MPPILQLDLQQILSQTLSFLILWWLLRRFAWRPLLGILDARRAHIERELREAAQRKQEAARLQEDYAQRLAKIHDEARTKLQEAILEGKRISLEIQEQARAQSQALVTKSRETIELEVAKARETLRGQMVGMTMEALERILRQKVDTKADHALMTDVLNELEHTQA